MIPVSEPTMPAESEASFRDQVTVGVEASLWGAFSGFKVYVDEPKSLPETLVPFKVVQERPMVIADDGNSFVHGPSERTKMAPQKINSGRVVNLPVLIGPLNASHTIFSDENGL